ncbi:unnamed protein product [Candidula unifasciata]|uniref:Uncharacterized protein n=1 Tax=Candidula unifasciata TaxID=100452 RepID=A0A8S3YZB1_9EUPU|nr:unnamed protein product [Candidula unifasciata]
MVSLFWMFEITTNPDSNTLNDQNKRHTLNVNTEKIANKDMVTSMKSSTCVFPDVNIFEPSVVAIAGLNLSTLQCDEFYLPDLTYIQDTTIIVNTSKVQQYHGNGTFQHCKYRHIWRNDSDDNSYIYSDWSDPFTDKIQLPRNSEFVRVQCWNIRSELVSNTYMCLVPRKEEFDGLYLASLKKREVESAPKETLNVVMIVMDSLQRNQLIRGCNETYAYLMNTLKSFDLTMHSQLAKNTFPNFMPLFTDHFEHEIDRWWNKSLPMDAYDMIWYAFEKAGYRTTYAESSDWGAFHWQRKGFIQPFSRFYPRPLDLALNDDKSLGPLSKYCAGSQLHLNFRLNYIGRLLDTFSDKPVFAVGMMSKETHDDQSYAKYFDEHLLNFYKWMRAKGHLNRTLVVALSDHGTRWGKFRDSVNGHFESRTPFTILTFPEWFLKKYPDVAENLRINTKRLTSHFDTHATLLDLLYFKSDYPPPLPPNRYGLSLLKEIPWNRTCKEASIPAEFCMCGYREVEDIDIHSELSKHLSHLLIKSINEMIENVCAQYKLTQTIRVVKVIFQGSDTQKQQGDALYKVTVKADPGGAIFEAYKEVTGIQNPWTFANYIFRLNSYKGQSDCAQHPLIKPMCYCKNLLG